MWVKWLPWRLVLSQFAKSRGFIDPVRLMSRLHRFAQPSEVTEPIELLRAGVIFHARGLINSRAIQHNLDWVWPFWIERQFDPRDNAFVPRAFSITHVNLTHRNWTAVGLPGVDWLPIVDPCGLVTPYHDGWSVDTWFVPESGHPVLPSRAPLLSQQLNIEDTLTVDTQVQHDGDKLLSTVAVVWRDVGSFCQLRVAANVHRQGWLVIAIRPVNPEGISFIHDIELDEDRKGFLINDETHLYLERPADRVCMSRYRDGDVLQRLVARDETQRIRCDVGLGTAAAMYRVAPGESVSIGASFRIPNQKKITLGQTGAIRYNGSATQTIWNRALEGTCSISIPDQHMQFLFDAAIRCLILHSPGDIYPGPFTYKRFWFRDAAFILHALLMVGLFDSVKRALQRFPDRQTHRGYFLSQEGEWDSNGAAIWIIDQYSRLSGEPLPNDLITSVEKGAYWIEKKRLSDGLDELHAGLLPAGFSAEHLGPNDYYYWDDFWSVAGSRSAAAIMRQAGQENLAAAFEQDAELLLQAIDRSLEKSAPKRDHPGVPASPHRRMDAGAIGSLAGGYPLKLWASRDRRLLDTVEFLVSNCFVKGGFFQDMIHSGINAYLTLHVAQVLLRAGDERHFGLIKTVAQLASPTGQWPEAIHPHTHGGCMGDGQHMWAAAEWILMMRNLFVREERGRLIIGSGLPREWLNAGGAVMRFGPTPTPFGPITIAVTPRINDILVRWDAAWRRSTPEIEICLHGCAPASPKGEMNTLSIERLPT